MTTKTITLAQLPKALEREIAHVHKQVKKAIARTTRKGVRVVRRSIPNAHGDLRDSVHDTPTTITIDAPHASALEVGAAPHMPPLGPIIKWVKQRGMQALTSKQGRVSRARNVEHQAKTIAAEIRALGRPDGSTPIDAIEQIARRIQASIAKHGSRPLWYARSSLPEVIEILGSEIDQALKSKDT